MHHQYRSGSVKDDTYEDNVIIVLLPCLIDKSEDSLPIEPTSSLLDKTTDTAIGDRLDHVVAHENATLEGLADIGALQKVRVVCVD